MYWRASLWQKSYFGNKCLDEEIHYVVSVFDILKDVVLEIRFNAESVWFGGEQSGLKTDPLNNAITFLSCCWHAAALVISICDANEIQNLLKASTRMIPLCSCLSAALLTQDERCLSVPVALLRLEAAKIDIPPQLNAMCLFRHILFSISYDYKVILDWLHSELAAVPFVLRFLKMLIKQQKKIDEQQYSSFSCLQCCEKNKKARFVRSKKIPPGNELTLYIRQLHGDLPITTSYTFSRTEREVCMMMSKSNEEESGDQQIVKCFENLRTSCIRLHNSGDAPFNVMPIIGTVEQLSADSVQIKIAYERPVIIVVLTMSSSGSDRHRSKSHSPRSERSDSRSNSPPRRRSRSRSVDQAAEQLGRLHICNFDESLRKDDLKDAFGKFGDIDNVWLASYPPLFAFVTFKAKEDAADALKEMNNAYIGRNRIKVATAHPPRKPGERGPPRRYGGGGYRGGGGPRSYGGYGRGGGYGGGGYGGRSGNPRSYGGGGYRSSYSGSGNGSDRRSGSNRYSDRR
ncbi:Serine/arginine-rich splicing factor [Dirofilaria immitis]